MATAPYDDGRTTRRWREVIEGPARAHHERLNRQFDDRIRDAIDAVRDEDRLRQDLKDYELNVRLGRVERDDAWEARLQGFIAAAERRQEFHPYRRHREPVDVEREAELLTLF